MLPTLIALAAGLIVGSFLNVVIARVPAGLSVVSPRSRCPLCLAPIAFYDNIPVVSYLALRGKCRACGASISPSYPLVELLTGAVFVAAYRRFGTTPALFLDGFFFAVLIALVLIDLRHRILPDALTLPLIPVGLSLSYFQDPSIMESGLLQLWLAPDRPLSRGLLHATQSLLGMLFGGGMLWLVAFLYLKVKKIEGMGAGDIKLMTGIGAFLGWSLAWLTIFLGSLAGAIVGSAYMVWQRKTFRYELPFGTFLGAGAIVSALWGPDLLHWYSRLYR